MKTKKEKPLKPGDAIYFVRNTDEHPTNWEIEGAILDANDYQADGPIRAMGLSFYTKAAIANDPHAYRSRQEAVNVIDRAVAAEAKAEAQHYRTLQDLRDKLRIGDGCEKSFRDLVTNLCRAQAVHAVKVALEASVVANALQAAYTMGVADSEANHKD